MIKLKFLGIAVFATVIMTPICYGQPFQAPASGAKSGPVSVIPEPPKPMSPGDFKAQVKVLDQKSQADLMKQLTESAKPSSPLPSQTLEPKKEPAEEPSTKEKTEADAFSPAVTAPEKPAFASPAPALSEPAPAAPATSVSTSSPPSPPQSQAYTGFGAGGSTGNNSSTDSKSGGSLGIKY